MKTTKHRNEYFDFLRGVAIIFVIALHTHPEQMNKMEMTEVYHTGHIYDPAKRFCSDDIITEINGEFTYPAIITYYKEFDSEERWVSIVNGHQRYANLFRVYFTCGEKRVFWLAPGEMKLFKLSEILDAAKKVQE